MVEQQLIRSTRDQILDVLRGDVFSGRLKAGARVSEAKLAERFGVSRGPIREALSHLASEGLVIVKPNCGVTVAPPPPDDIRELILPIRNRLEVYALRRIHATLGDSDFRYWNELLDRMEMACRKRDIDLLPQLDVELHRSIILRANQPDLLAIWNAIATRMRAHFWETVQRVANTDDVMSLHTHHVELIESFRSGNSKVAEKALAKHIDEN